MSSAILRRNSSKQGLQNLLRVTAQRSIEDAEEVERERRRRARESFRRGSNTSGPGGPSQNNGSPTEDGLYDSDLKPGGSSPSLEEDEGFSDWTQRLEKRRQQRMEELGQGKETDEEAVADGAAGTPERAAAIAVTAAPPLRLQVQSTEEEEREESLTRNESEKRRKGGREELAGEERAQREGDREKKAEKQQVERTKSEEEDQGPEVGTKVKGKEVKVSYTSKVFLNQKVKHNGTNGNAPREDMVKTKRTLSRPALQAEAGEAEEAEAILETEQKLEKIRRSHQEKESQELEQLKLRQVEAEQELEQLRRRREARRGVRQEEERRREEEEQQRLAKEEEEKRRMKEDIERRRMEAAERMKTLSTSTMDGEEIFSPLSPKGPTFKRENEEGLTAENTSSITERTESLNRSLKKSNSFKKTQPPVLLSKIDDKLEQYTHAIETSQEAKAAKQAPTDIIGPPEAVASKKNLFEAGEAWSQTPTKGTPCKEAEGLKVGVADLITQWVKGSPDGSAKQPPAKPSDVRPGDVMQKKNMWEIIGEESSGRPGQGTKGTPSGKRFKFVVTGHGKYEKFPTADEDGNEYTNDNGKSDLCSGDY